MIKHEEGQGHNMSGNPITITLSSADLDASNRFYNQLKEPEPVTARIINMRGLILHTVTGRIRRFTFKHSPILILKRL